MNAPAVRADRAGAAILGVPFDAGSHPTRVGARLGPSAIREQSSLIMPFDPVTGANLVERVRLVDHGDVAVVPGDIDASFPPTAGAIEAIAAAGVVPVVLGGDGLITLPSLRALGPLHPNLAVVHIDAHTDSYPGDGYTTAHTFSRAVEENLIDPNRSFHIGLRGTTYDPRAWSHARELGFQLVTMDEWRQQGTGALVSRIAEAIDGRPAYLSFDMDVFDPSVAPGVCTPAWGGITATEGLDLLDQLRHVPWVGFDNQTVSPPHDVGGMTALLAGTVVARFLTNLSLAVSS